MWISELDAAGIACCDDPHTLERSDVLPRPWMDALTLAAVGAGAPLQAAERLGWGLELNQADTSDPEAEPDGSLPEVTLSRPGNARRVLTDTNAHVTLTLQPDPPLFGRLRNAVLRDPAQAAGLQKGTLSARIGWLFTPDYRFATRDRLGASLGDVSVPRTSTWIGPLLTELVQRIVHVGEHLPLQALHAAELSAESEQRDSADRALTFASTHFGLDLRLVRTDRLEPAIGPDLRPLHWFGPAAARHLRLVLTTELLQPDVLLVPYTPDEQERAYLDARLDGDHAVLEQVLVAG